MDSKPIFILGKPNLKLILIALFIVITGYFLMAGSSNNGNANFNDDIFSFVRITVSPILIMLGYVIMIVAIMIRPKQ